ncbi:MAG: hypothetical protein ACOCZS_04710 [Verrucomicrobiota bacterium]
MADTDNTNDATDEKGNSNPENVDYKSTETEAKIKELEEILQVFPDDTDTLESLLTYYQQANRKEDAFNIGLKLAEILSSQSEWQQVRAIASSLLELKPDDEKAEILLENANLALSEESDDTDRQQPAKTDDEKAPAQNKAKNLKPNISAELDLAWMLMQNGFINQQQYKTAVSSLTENRRSAYAQTNFSILLEISTLEGIDIQDIMGFLVQKTRMPYIEIGNFELDRETTEIIPPTKCRVIGILPFARLNDEFMAVTLNPMNKELLQDVSVCLGGETHFYLCDPATLEELLSRLISE